MNSFDYSILLALNELADSFPILTKVIVGTYENSLKTALIAAILWYAWFGYTGSQRQHEVRERIAACLISSLVCAGFVRLLAALLPFRFRPIANPSHDLDFPIGVEG
jgi:undecaprenyl-diphosphatase